MLDSKYQVIGFVGEYKTTETRCLVKCTVHGLGNEWETPWIPTITNLKKKYGCPKCGGNYRPSKNEVVKELKTLLDEKYTFVDFVNGEYKNNQSKCIIKCSEHGKGEDWGTPWTPKIDTIRKGSRCPKCVKKYNPTASEVLEDINKNTPHKVKALGIYGKYTGKNSKCIAKCEIHGSGEDFDKPWRPTIDHLKNGAGCPKCAVEGSSLRNCLKNPEHFEKERILYYIKFKHKNEVFYKIGLTFKNIKERYSGVKLKKNRIEVIDYVEVKLSNIHSMLSEYWILRTFAKQRKEMFHVMKDISGGSECFSEDITQIMSLNEMIKSACLNYEGILEDFDLSKEELNKINKEIKKSQPMLASI